MTQTKQQLSQSQQAVDIVNQLMQRPDGQQLLMSMVNGQPYQPPQAKPTAEIPGMDDPEFFDWVGKSPKNLAAFVQQQSNPYTDRIEQQDQTIKSILGFLEQEAVEKKYGGQMKELSPFLQQVDQQLGQNAQYYPVDQRMLMARGLQAEQATATASADTLQKQTEQDQIDRHRDKVLAETVETANTTAKTESVVNFSKLNAKQMRAALIQAGVKYDPSD
jgi:hypothetical protein